MPAHSEVPSAIALGVQKNGKVKNEKRMQKVYNPERTGGCARGSEKWKVKNEKRMQKVYNPKRTGGCARGSEKWKSEER
ncbi:hypothetical protein, partial [Thermoleptolyngbya sp. C42_A2020_037]|uniref:hypothetical protein n=1 Tax=Thermoleptolyngbya sp. C42_A2020_037 TaxID=2747799 RepID=UPI0025F2EDFA